MSLHTLLEAAHFVDTDSDEENHKKTKRSASVSSATPSLDIQIGLSEASRLDPATLSAATGSTPTTPSRSKRLSRVVGAGATREVHNQLEKNRRAHLKLCFDGLRQQLPGMWDKKSSNLSVLKGAINCIEDLKRKDREYELEANQLRRQKRMKQEQLRSLRSEMGAEEVDRILSQATVTMRIEQYGSGGTVSLVPADDPSATDVRYVEVPAAYVSSCSAALSGSTKWHSHIQPSSSSSSSMTSSMTSSTTSSVVLAAASTLSSSSSSSLPPIRIELGQHVEANQS